jgi:hypothetical protein
MAEIVCSKNFIKSSKNPSFNDSFVAAAVREAAERLTAPVAKIALSSGSLIPLRRADAGTLAS